MTYTIKVGTVSTRLSGIGSPLSLVVVMIALPTVAAWIDAETPSRHKVEVFEAKQAVTASTTWYALRSGQLLEFNRGINVTRFSSAETTSPRDLRSFARRLAPGETSPAVVLRDTFYVIRKLDERVLGDERAPKGTRETSIELGIPPIEAHLYRPVDCRFTGVKLDKVIVDICRQVETWVVFDESAASLANSPVTLHLVGQVPARRALELVLAPLGLRYSIRKQNILVKSVDD